MYQWTFLLVAPVLFAQGSLFAQVSEFRAKIAGSGGPSGKCTVEVDVDEAAEIQIFGDTGRMQTLGGQPATWKRMDCTSAMPPSPANFKFHGVDGRGRQTLVRDPNEGLGVAVIRIEDSQRGREGYTFDIEWSNGGANPVSNNNGNNNGGFGDNRGNGGGFGQNAQATGVVDFAYAVHACQSAIVNRAAQSGFTNVVVWSANLQDTAGNTDQITGNATATAARGGNNTRVQYSCAVDATNGRVVDLQIR